MDTLENIGARAKIAYRLLAVAGTARKNEALTAMARALAAHSDDILAANRQDVAAAFVGSRDIRDKYLCSSLLWDIGLMDDFAQRLKNA